MIHQLILKQITKNFKKIKVNLINCNPNYESDIYLNGWIDNDNKK